MNSEKFANIASIATIIGLVCLGAYVIFTDRHPDLTRAESAVIDARSTLDHVAAQNTVTDDGSDHREAAIKALDVALAQIRQAKGARN